MVRLAVIGFGGFGWQLVNGILAAAERRDCELVAAADNRLADLGEKADELAAKGVALFDDATQMYRKMAGFHSGMSFFGESYRVVVVGAGAWRCMTWVGFL